MKNPYEKKPRKNKKGKKELKGHVKIKGPPKMIMRKKKWEVEEATYIVPCKKIP